MSASPKSAPVNIDFRILHKICDLLIYNKSGHKNDYTFPLSSWSKMAATSCITLLRAIFHLFTLFSLSARWKCTSLLSLCFSQQQAQCFTRSSPKYFTKMSANSSLVDTFINQIGNQIQTALIGTCSLSVYFSVYI